MSPFLDVSDVSLDPDFATVFTVLRRAAGTDAKGWNTPTTTTINGVVGTITNASPNDLLRLPDAQRQEKSISIVTNFALRGASRDAAPTDYAPDLIVYEGNTFVIVLLDDLTAFGGQVQAIAQMTDYTPSAPGTAGG